LKKEIDNIKAENKKSEEEVTETFMQELKEVEAKLEHKKKDADQHSKESARLA